MTGLELILPLSSLVHSPLGQTGSHSDQTTLIAGPHLKMVINTGNSVAKQQSCKEQCHMTMMTYKVIPVAIDKESHIVIKCDIVNCGDTALQGWS